MADPRSFAVLRHPLTLAGAWLTTVSAVLFLIVFCADLLGLLLNPYIGIVAFLLLPGFFVLGLLLIPLGIVAGRWRRHAGRPAAPFVWPRVDLNVARQRRVAAFVLLMTLINVVIVSLAAYRGIEYMDSVAFCGQVCHAVMQPEFTAYRNGPHARVPCVSCHIGPGAPWFVRSKLSGTRQVFAVAFNTYPRPIPSPVTNLRPARETCEQCHWPEKFTGDRVTVVREFGDDETVRESTTGLQLHIGGGSDALGASGIHWHMAPSTRITYVTTDRKRQVIVSVRVEDRRGPAREFRAEGVTAAQLAQGESRTMDCMDCHNRPSHRFDPTPERAVDEAIATAVLPRSLPFIHREAVAALRLASPSQAAASEAIARRLTGFYGHLSSADNPVATDAITRAVGAVQNIYRRNVFPGMHVTWGTYVNNLGHVDTPGCFRCHDDNHKARDGRVIRQDCDICHKIE